VFFLLFRFAATQALFENENLRLQLGYLFLQQVFAFLHLRLHLRLQHDDLLLQQAFAFLTLFKQAWPVDALVGVHLLPQTFRALLAALEMAFPAAGFVTQFQPFGAAAACATNPRALLGGLVGSHRCRWSIGNCREGCCKWLFQVLLTGRQQRGGQ
jgi:hypothetical protein